MGLWSVTVSPTTCGSSLQRRYGEGYRGGYQEVGHPTLRRLDYHQATVSLTVLMVRFEDMLMRPSSHQHHGPYTEEYFEDSLKNLDTDYVDLVSGLRALLWLSF